MRQIFKLLCTFGWFPTYALGKNIKRGRYFRAFLWMFPSFVTLRLFNRSYDLSHRVVTNIYLKENGTQVVMYTLNGRKHVLNISDFFQQGKDQYCDSLEEMPNYYPLGHMVGDKEKTFLIDHTEANFPEGKDILKAIINGYNIDTANCKLSNTVGTELS